MPQERIARVRFFDEGVLLPQISEMSLYDLNSHPILQYSLGDHVLIRSKLLPPAGLVEEVVSLAAGFVEGLVRNITELADDPAPAHQRAASGLATEPVDWMGEIVKINTDGTVRVRLAREAEPGPEWTGERYADVKGEDLIVFEVDDEEDEEAEEVISVVDATEPWSYSTQGVDVWFQSDSDDEWEDASEGDMQDDEIPEASLDGMDDVEPLPPVATNGHPEDAPSPTVIKTDPLDSNVNKEKCPGFDILETIPSDHPFKSDNTNRNAADWLSRIRKEHKILQTSLPGMSSSIKQESNYRRYSCPHM